MTNNGVYNASVNNAAPGVITNNLTWNGNLLSNTGTVTNVDRTLDRQRQQQRRWNADQFRDWTGSVANAGTFNNATGAVSGGLTTAGTF